MSEADAPPLAPGRVCGDCHMCCKVFPLPETGKSPFGLCPRLTAQGLCSTYAARPEPCRAFFCAYRYDGSLPEEWRPSVAGFVLHDPEPWALLVSVDPDRPDSWRREPYHSQLRDWARDFGRRQWLMGLRIGARTSLLLSDREVLIDEGVA